MRATGRDEKLVQTVEMYYKEQGLWRDDARKISYSATLELDLSKVEPALAGPRRPQDRVGAFTAMREQWRQDLCAAFMEGLPERRIPRLRVWPTKVGRRLGQ